MIDAEKIIRETYPELKISKDNKLLLKLVKKLIHEDDFNYVIETNKHLRGFAFLDKLLAYFNFSYQASPRSYNNIPAEGRLLVVANHPIGTLDGLALVKFIRSVRPDVRIVANQILSHMQPLGSVFLPVDVLSKNAGHKKSYLAMLAALENEEAVIVFPAGEVSRITPKGVRDGKWKSGFIKLAKKAKCPILPVHIQASNSLLFYGMSTLYKPLGTAMLVKEMFNKNDQELKFRVGSPIPYKAFIDEASNAKQLSQKFYQHVQNLSKKKKVSLFDTVETIAHPVNSKALKKSLYKSELLGETKDGKKIFLYDFKDDCPVMQEIARLRELTFRTVEEGTGEAQDFDEYDIYYRHLVLWDVNDLEIVGSYRLGEGSAIMKAKGIEGFYTNSLFKLNPEYKAHFNDSIELGRSFVQPRYWGQRSLDYLWYGIGAYLRANPEKKYLFGPVSMSNSYPDGAKQLIIGFYKQQFSSDLNLAEARNPFVVTKKVQKLTEKSMSEDYKISYKLLNADLKKLGVKVPTLYKQYAEVCNDQGCHFIDFNVDADFGDCIDSLIMIEIDKITDKKKQRYIKKSL